MTWKLNQSNRRKLIGIEQEFVNRRRITVICRFRSFGVDIYKFDEVQCIEMERKIPKYYVGRPRCF